MDFKDFGDLMPDILTEVEMVYVSTKTIDTKDVKAAYHNKDDCWRLRNAHPENVRRIPLKLAKWLDYKELCATCRDRQRNVR